jgi:hypothetical protein
VRPDDGATEWVVMAQRIIAGFVNENAKPTGTGFRVTRTKGPEGTFDITFNQPFREPPAVVAAQVYPNDPKATIMVNTLANVIVLGISEFGFRLTVGAPNGRPVARAFTFVAVGRSGTPPYTGLLECLKEEG